MGLPPHLDSLVRAIGLLGPDGRVDPEWFEHPLHDLRTIVSNPFQRAALLELLDLAAPSVPGGAGTTDERWHPLLDAGGRGNVYLVVAGDILGVTASIETPPGFSPLARASLRLPLVDLSGGTVRAIAGSTAAPLEVTFTAAWGAGSHPSGLTLIASADVDGAGSLRVVLEDLDPERPPGTRTALDAANLN